MRSHIRAGTALVLLVASVAGTSARAQPYGYDDDAPPPGYYEERRIYRRVPAPPPARGPVGFNCDAVQQGISGPQPYSCPLPGPKPLGARCFCDLPLASFSPQQTAVGRVVR